MKKDILTIILTMFIVITFSSCSYIIGIYLFDAFNEPMIIKFLSTLVGVMILLFLLFVIKFIYLLFLELKKFLNKTL